MEGVKIGSRVGEDIIAGGCIDCIVARSSLMTRE